MFPEFYVNRRLDILLHAVFRADEARAAEGLHIVADDVVDVGERHLRGEDIAHRVHMPEKEEALVKRLVVDGRVGAQIEKMCVLEECSIWR